MRTDREKFSALNSDETAIDTAFRVFELRYNCESRFINRENAKFNRVKIDPIEITNNNR